MHELLATELEKVTGYLKDRRAVGLFIADNPEWMPHLLDFCVGSDINLSFKACWVLEQAYLAKPEILYPHLDAFIKNLQQLRHESAIRPMAHLVEEICISYFRRKNADLMISIHENQLETLTETCFDWLINDEKVAAKAYAMGSLYWLGKKFAWVNPELKRVLSEDMSNHTNAYKSKANKVLAMLIKKV